MKRGLVALLSLLLANISLAQEVTNNSFHFVLKEKFLEGGWQFMSLTLICLVVGLSLFIMKIIQINQHQSNAQTLLEEIEQAVETGGTRQLRQYLVEQKGSTARMLKFGLDRIPDGFGKVHEALQSQVSVFHGSLNENLPWISLFIALAPMLGFMGTVLGMIAAFDAIAQLGSSGMNAGVVASGIKIALITTVSGLIIAVVLQLFYNYLVNKVEGLINSFEDTCSTFLDILILDAAKKR